MNILEWLAAIPYPALLLIVLCVFLLLLFLLLSVAFSDKAADRIIRVIKVLQNGYMPDRCPKCRSLLKRRAMR